MEEVTESIHFYHSYVKRKSLTIKKGIVFTVQGKDYHGWQEE